MLGYENSEVDIYHFIISVDHCFVSKVFIVRSYTGSTIHMSRIYIALERRAIVVTIVDDPILMYRGNIYPYISNNS